ncbi:MAG TPA: hypothetical protein VGC87_03035 [Pyrinomonadaceae bacterium]|jgi:hypothetical protein
MKMKLYGILFVLALAAILLALLAAARVGVTRAAQEGPTVIAIFENRSTESVNVYAAGELFGPNNRLAPGQRREMLVRVPPDGRVTFYAVRDGWVLAVAVWDGSPEHTDRFPVVTFMGPGRLVVMTAL